MKRNPSLAKPTMRLYFQASKRYPKAALIAFLNPIGAILMSVAVPFYAGRALAAIVVNNGSFSHAMAGLVISSILGIAANRFGNTRMWVLQANVMSDLNDQAFGCLLSRGVRFHNDNIGGKLVSDVVDYVNAYGTLITSIYNTGLPFLAILLSGLVIITVQSWQLGLYLLGVVLITLTWAYLESRTRFAVRNKRLVATKRVTAHLADSIVNASTVKAFARETEELAEGQQLNHKLRDLRLHDWQRASRSGNHRLAALFIMLIILLLLVKHLARTDPNIFSTGIFAFTYTFTIIVRLFDLNALTRQVEEAFLQAVPITQILQEEIEVKDSPEARPLEVKTGGITFEHVHFRYEDAVGNEPVFGSLQLHIAAGEKIGLVGPSGGGKSTLTRLLLRFDDIQSGHILVDGQDIALVTQASLRKSISYVQQEPLLFHRSVAANIAYGRPEATQADIIEAARKAYAHEFVSLLPHGYDTIVGERGVKLSGGQRQRIAIARAMLKDAPLLVLDEATSALDSESEKVIQEALWNLMRERTSIVIAHRLSTIQKMDRIVVLDKGEVVEEGTHKDLLTRGGLYARLWAHQSGGFIEE